MRRGDTRPHSLVKGLIRRCGPITRQISCHFAKQVDPVAPFVAALVILEGFLVLLTTWDAVAYPFAFQRFPEPVGVITAISKQPVNLGQAARQYTGADVIADLSRGHEQIQRASLPAADDVQFGVHASFCPASLSGHLLEKYSARQ